VTKQQAQATQLVNPTAPRRDSAGMGRT
jgi:hypothetical protein